MPASSEPPGASAADGDDGSDDDDDDTDDGNDGNDACCAKAVLVLVAKVDSPPGQCFSKEVGSDTSGRVAAVMKGSRLFNRATNSKARTGGDKEGRKEVRHHTTRHHTKHGKRGRSALRVIMG